MDVTEPDARIRDLEQQLAQARALLRGVVDTMADPWILLNAVRDASGQVVDFTCADTNEPACVATGRTRAALIGSGLRSLSSEDDPSVLVARYAAVVETGVPLLLDGEPSVSPVDGTERYVDRRVVKAGDGLSVGWRDVTERVRAHQELERMALHDPLTGLPNRFLLGDRMAALFSQVPRTGTHLAVLFCDLDRFKEVNDSVGRDAGDSLLRTVGARIAAAVRGDDVVARLGGDEFVVVLPGVHGAADAIGIAEKIRGAVAAPLVAGGREVRTTMSIGVATARTGDDPDQVLRAADVALYRAKEAGRDQVTTLTYLP